MSSISKRAPILVFTAVSLGVCMIGWLARTTIAQDLPKHPAPSPALPDSAPPPLQELPAASSNELVAPQATPAPAAPAFADISAAASGATKPAPSPEPANLPAPELPGSSLGVPETAKVAPLASSNEPTLEANKPVGGNAEDPEKSAMAFVEQNQRTAESQLASLKTEEAKLRERLRKVEAGIKRWESLLGALKQSQGSVAIVGPGGPGNWKQAEPNERGPQRIEPLPKSERLDLKK